MAILIIFCLLQLSRALETFDVEEKPGYHVESLGVEVLKTSVVGLDAHKHVGVGFDLNKHFFLGLK